jgi:VWFA-related protein
VNLEAVVVDKAGDRVSGLVPGDFVLEVDGKPTPIGYFSEVEDGVAVETELPTLDGGSLVAPAGISPGEAVGTSYLVFIDSYFTTHAARRNRILDEIQSQLLRLGPNDRIALVAFGGRKLEVLSSWSRSEAQLADAFDRARALRARGLITDAIASQVDRDRGREAAIVAAAATQDAAFSDGATAPTVTGAVRRDGLPSDICSSIRLLESRVRRQVLAVTAALRSFAKPPGRKLMIVLSGGWPHSVKEYLVSTAGPFAAGECKAEGPKIYRPIYDTANRLGYTLYPVDIPAPDGLAINASSSGAALFGEDAPIGPVGATAQFDRQFEVHTTLQRMAVETGGRALIDGTSLSAFDRVISDTRSYYWLGFTPEWKGNDKAHDIRLKVTRPGLKIRSRKGFLDFSRQTEVSYVTESALLFGDLPGASNLGVEFGPLPEKGKRRLEIPIRLSIPLDQVAMLPVGDTYIAELELRIGVLDETGNRNEMPVIPVTLEGKVAPEPGSHAIYETAIKMRKQAHDIVISIYDPLSDTVMAATGRIGAAGEMTAPAR